MILKIKINIIKEKLRIYSQIENNLINSSNNNFKYFNFELLQNINDIDNKNIINDIIKIIDEYNIDKFNNILDKLSKINSDEIIIKYKINNSNSNYSNDKIKIFGGKFVKNNKNYCKIIYKEKIFELSEYFDIKEIDNNNNTNILEIKLIGLANINNMSCMFSSCSLLLSFHFISELNISNIIDMSSIFESCSSLSYLPDISKWNTLNVEDINSMFYECSSLISLPDISKWNTKNITDISYIFYGCSLLLSLPDISKWNTSNITNFCCIFDSCSSLQSLPDISKWNTSC